MRTTIPALPTPTFALPSAPAGLHEGDVVQIAVNPRSKNVTGYEGREAVVLGLVGKDSATIEIGNLGQIGRRCVYREDLTVVRSRPRQLMFLR